MQAAEMDWGFICMRCGTLVNYPSLWGSRAMGSWGEESLAWGGAASTPLPRWPVMHAAPCHSPAISAEPQTWGWRLGCHLPRMKDRKLFHFLFATYRKEC